MVYLSTVGVYGDHAGAWVDETTPPQPELGRGRERLAAEQAWQDFGAQHGVAVAILRLAGIYGPGQNALVQVASGKARRVVKPGQVFNRIHVGDIAQAIDAAFSRARPAIFNVADDEPTPAGDPIVFAAKLLGREPPPEIAFEDAAPSMSPMALSFWQDCRRVRNDKLKRELGVTLRYPTYREGLRALFEEAGICRCIPTQAGIQLVPACAWTSGRVSMQAWALEEPVALARFDAQLHGLAVAIDRDRHVDTGLALRPDAAEEAGEIATSLPATESTMSPVRMSAFFAGPRSAARRRPAGYHFGGIEAEPRPRRHVAPAEFHQIVDDRLEQIDRHHHVDVLRLAFLGGVLQLQRADAEQVAGRADQRGAAPVRMRRRGEDRFVEHIFPIAGEFLLGDDAGGDRALPPAKAADDDALADRGRRPNCRFRAPARRAWRAPAPVRNPVSWS